MTAIRISRQRATTILAVSLSILLLLPGTTLGTATPASQTMSADRPAQALVPVGGFTPRALGPGSASPRSARASVLPFRSLAPDALSAAKLRAAAQLSVGQRTPVTNTLPSTGLYNGLNQAGLSDYAVTPPDSTGAIGPNNYVEMVNQQVGVYDRNLAQISTTDMGTFTGASLLQTVSDPQIQWDPQGGRWLYAAVAVSQGDNYLLFGWSKTTDPSDLSNGWCRFGIGRGSELDDYPKLGHSDGVILIGSNVYTDAVPGYQFQTATIWAIPKPAAGDTSCTGPSTAWYFADAAHPLLNQDGTTAYTPVPANTIDASGAGYIVSAHTPLSDNDGYLGPQNTLEMWHVVGGTSPSLVADGGLTVPSFDIPASAPQPGSSFTIDTLDARLTQAVAVKDPGAGGVEAVWTQHTVAGAGGRSEVRWYELLGGGTPGVRQEGTVSSATDFVYNAAISPTKGGDAAAIFYNRSSSSQLPLIGGLSRSSATPLGTMDAGELLLGSSSASDVDPSCSASTPCRWGDYSGATPDPVNDGVVWGSNQVTGGCYILCGWFSQWQTRNFAVVASTGSPSPSVPTAPQSLSATANDGSIDLSWSPPLSDGGSAITNYELYRGTAPGAESWVAELGNVNAYTDGGLTNGTTYYYTVSAKNGVGEGPASDEASATPQPPPATDPGAPTLTTAMAGNGTVSLAWTAPTSDGGSPITNYTIYRGTSAGAESFLVTVGNVTSYIDANVVNGTTYWYTVAAVNGVGTGPASNELSAMPSGGDFTVGATPGSVSVARGGSATYSVLLSPTGGFAGTVTLSASVPGKTRGMSFSFAPTSLAVPGQTSSVLTVGTARNTGRGTYTITITATGGGLTRTTTVTLVVT